MIPGRLVVLFAVSALVFAMVGSACGSGAGTGAFADGDILFVRKEDKGLAIYAMSRDGDRVRRVVEGQSPRWSPDGSRFAYLRDETGLDDGSTGTSLWIMNAESGDNQRVMRGDEAGGLDSFAWAPDGVRLAVSDGFGLFIYDAERDESVRARLGGTFDFASIDWSPDGREVLTSHTLGIVAVDLESGNERGISREIFAGSGRWSPDGRQVAFTKGQGRPGRDPVTHSIFVMGSSGGPQARLTHGFYDSAPAWSPDGARIYFDREPAWDLSGRDAVDVIEEGARKTEIYSVDVDSRALRRLTTNRVLDSSPDPRPPDRSLPEPPEPRTGDIVVPDLVRQQITFEDERQRFAALGLTLKRPSLARDPQSILLVLEQTPRGGSRVPEGTSVELLAWDVSDPFAGRMFSSPVWKAHPNCEEEANPRGRMYSDLVGRVLKKGMARKRIVELLGRPTRSDEQGVEYALGYWSGFGVDCDYLRVNFDPKDAAKRIYKWQS